jgi:DNA-binding XRE family transcriptional regulator
MPDDSRKWWSLVVGPSRLHDWRTRANRTQQMAAEMCGLDLASYNSFERGRERPGLVAAVKIERATNRYVRADHWVEDEKKAKRASA